MASTTTTTMKPSSRYSSSESDPSPSSLKHRNPMAPMDNSSRAIVRTRSANIAPSSKNPSTLGTMVKKFMEKKSGLMPALAVPSGFIAEDFKKVHSGKGKASNFTANLHRKLFHKGGSTDKALTEVRANTRTLAMVLRSERELLGQNKEHEEEIQELRLLVEEKNREVEKLKDLCLKQREEIKALKDAILFPDVMNAQLNELFEKQGMELKQAKRIIPSLQKQVSSLTGQLQCLADDLAEVKADKYTSMTYFDGQSSSPETPEPDQEAQNSLEYSSGCPMTYGSPDEMFLKDLNPCLTPCFSKTKSKEYDHILGYDSASKDALCTELGPDNFSCTLGGILSKSSEQRHRSGQLSCTARKIYKSDESKRSIGRPKNQSLF